VWQTPQSIYILDQGEKLSRYSHVRLSVRVNNEILEMVRPISTKFGVNTSYTCKQIKLILNFGCNAPFAHKVKKGKHWQLTSWRFELEDIRNYKTKYKTYSTNAKRKIINRKFEWRSLLPRGILLRALPTE